MRSRNLTVTKDNSENYGVFSIGLLAGIALLGVILSFSEFKYDSEFARDYCRAKGYDTAKEWNFETDDWHVLCEKKPTEDIETKNFREQSNDQNCFETPDKITVCFKGTTTETPKPVSKCSQGMVPFENGNCGYVIRTTAYKIPEKVKE